MLGVFAEFETNLRRERQLEGIAKAKAAGVYRGRKPSIDQAQVEKLKAEGLGATEIAKRLSIGRALSTASYVIVGAIACGYAPDLIPGPSKSGWGTRTSSTLCDIPNWRPIGSKIFGETRGLSLPYNEAPGN